MTGQWECNCGHECRIKFGMFRNRYCRAEWVEPASEPDNERIASPAQLPLPFDRLPPMLPRRTK
jgi:hypothetical protein